MIGRISVAILMLVALAGYLFSQRTGQLQRLCTRRQNGEHSQADRLSRSLPGTWNIFRARSEGEPNALHLCLARYG